MTDPNGKVSIYLGSSWLKLYYDIGVYMVSTESWNQLVMEFLNPLKGLEIEKFSFFSQSITIIYRTFLYVQCTVKSSRTDYGLGDAT
jgi:hypothetical protein